MLSPGLQNLATNLYLDSQTSCLDVQNKTVQSRSKRFMSQ